MRCQFTSLLRHFKKQKYKAILKVLGLVQQLWQKNMTDVHIKSLEEMFALRSPFYGSSFCRLSKHQPPSFNNQVNKRGNVYRQTTIVGADEGWR